MTGAGNFRIDDDQRYGVVVRCTDTEIADEFEDYLAEQGYVLFNIKFEDPDVVFYFGQASSRDVVEALLVGFLSE